MPNFSKVVKRDDSVVEYDRNKIANAIFKAAESVGGEDRKVAEELALKVEKLLDEKFDGENPTVEEIQDIVEKVLIEEGHAKTAKSYIVYREKRTELRKAKSILTTTRDDIKMDLNALTVLERRYLLKDAYGKVVETPKEMFERVAKNIAAADKNYNGDTSSSEKEFFDLMTSFEFIPNSPTLMNAGTELQQLAACFVLPVEDTMEKIFDAVKYTALIHKTGGGTGFSFSKLRPRNDVVQTTGGIASGPISFMRVFDVATDVIKQGGRRRGANMGILNVDHPDIFNFITAKERDDVLTNFNISVGITEAFMKAVKEGKEIDLISPRTGNPVRKVKARVIFDLIVYNAWRTGDPGIVFIDRLNRDNPTPNVGRIDSTNPCVTEDTFVFTSKGPMQVKDMIGKKFKAVVNGNLWDTDKDGFFSTGIKRVYKITTKEGFILKATENHPLKKVSKLTRYTMETVWTEVSSLSSNDKILVNNHRDIQEWEGNHTFEEGYLMGLLIGDGTIKKDKTVLSSWGEGEGVENMRNLAYTYAASMPHRADFTGWHKVKDREEYRLTTGALTHLANRLNVFPQHKIITEDIEKTSSKYHKGFLRGIFDADGSVQGSQKKGVSIRLSQSSLETLRAVQRMLLRLGVFSRIYKNRRESNIRLMPDGKGGKKPYKIKAQHELVISNDNIQIFYERIGFGDSKKMKKLKKLINNYKRTLNKERFVVAIEKIEYFGNEPVYDLQVPGINAFDANGFYAHNCGEQPLLPYEACNLGSINLLKMVKEDRTIDYDRLKKVVNTSVHFLDNVIDMSKYPIPQIEKMVKGNRKIGLGVMGFADMLIQLGIPYDSEEALSVGGEIMKFISKEAKKKSQELAKERGEFPNFKGSVYDKNNEPPIRNATLTTIAPTGTISIIGGCSSGIEPLFAVVFVRNVLEGTELLEVNKHFEKIAKEKGFFKDALMKEVARTGSLQGISGIPDDVKRLFVTAHDIAPEWHVRMQAAFQKYVDNAVSKTVNLPYYATPQDVERIYMLGYELNVKGITVYRDGSKGEQVIYTGNRKNEIHKDIPGGAGIVETSTPKSPAREIEPLKLSFGDKFLKVDAEYSGGCETCTI